jgi:hypothetical protein
VFLIYGIEYGYTDASVTAWDDVQEMKMFIDKTGISPKLFELNMGSFTLHTYLPISPPKKKRAAAATLFVI